MSSANLLGKKVSDRQNVEDSDGLQLVGPSGHLHLDTETGLYMYFGLPGMVNVCYNCFSHFAYTGLSHLCNSGDQKINSSLRQHIRRRTKQRMVHFGLKVDSGELPATACSEMEEGLCTDSTFFSILLLVFAAGIMNPLLVGWVCD